MQSIHLNTIAKLVKLDFLLQRKRRACNGSLGGVIADSEGEINCCGTAGDVDYHAGFPLAEEREEVPACYHGLEKESQRLNKHDDREKVILGQTYAFKINLDCPPEILE